MEKIILKSFRKEMIILFFLFILIIILFLFIAISTSKVRIEIKNLIFNTEAEKKIDKNSKIDVSILIFNKFKMFNKEIKFEKQDIDIPFLKKNDIKIDYLELFHSINIDIVKFDLIANIGTEDAGLTALVVGLVSAILGIIIKKTNFQINPVYANKNLLEIKFNGIFNVQMIHYIYKLLKNTIKREKTEFTKINAKNERFIGKTKLKT